MVLTTKKYRIKKTDLLKELGLKIMCYRRHLQILCTDKRTPFTYDQYKKAGHYIKTEWARYILEHL